MSCGPDAVCDVSFDVRPGESVALVGHPGAGKSTAAHLLMRFWDVDADTIRVGGQDGRDLPLRELVTFVPQDVYLFHDSAAANIRLGRPDATTPKSSRRRALRWPTSSSPWVRNRRACRARMMRARPRPSIGGVSVG